MARQKKAQFPLFENLDNVIEKAKEINNSAIQTTDMLVEEGLATGEKFHKILTKSLAKGTNLLEKQQDLAVENLAEVKNLYKSGTARFRKLFNIDKIEEELRDITTKATKQAKKVQKSAEKAIEEVEEDVIEAKDSVVKTTINFVKGARAKASEIMNQAANEAKPVVKKAAPAKAKKTEKKATAKTATKAKAKATTTAKKATSTVAAKTKKVVKAKPAKAQGTAATKSVAKKTTAVKKSPAKVVEKVNVKTIAVPTDISMINGIGPKLASILEEGGFKTIADVANAKLEDIQVLLENAGNRYKMFDATPWIADAKALLNK